MTPTEAASRQVILRIQDLRLHFPIRAGLLKKTVGYVKAVDGVSFDVYAGETVGLVGESGSGKTTIGRCIVRSVQADDREKCIFGRMAGMVDIAQLDKRELQPIRRDIQMLFQDPNSSLNARMRVGDIIAEPLEIHAIGTSDERRTRVEDLLEHVGLGAEMVQPLSPSIERRAAPAGGRRAGAQHRAAPGHLR